MKIRKILIIGGLALALLCAASIIPLLISVWNVATPTPAKLELLKFFLQLLLIVILGSITSLLIAEYNRQREKIYSDLDYARQRADAINDFREGILSRMVKAFSATKRARRLLKSRRSITLYDDENQQVIVGSLDVDSIKTFDCQMEAVIDAQLDLEAIMQDIETAKDAFTEPDMLKRDVVAMEEYLRKVIHEYQRLAPKLRIKEPRISGTDIPALSDFIGPYERSEFRFNFKRKYDSALKYIRKDVLLARRANPSHKSQAIIDAE